MKHHLQSNMDVDVNTVSPPMIRKDDSSSEDGANMIAPSHIPKKKRQSFQSRKRSKKSLKSLPNLPRFNSDNFGVAKEQ